MESLLLIAKYAFLGLLQGLTEPIPISSSGHLVIAQHLLGMHIEGLSFEVLVNFASLLAVLLIYRQDIMRLVRNGIGYLISKDPAFKPDFMFVVFVGVATVPAGIMGVLFGEAIGEKLKGMHVIGITLLITGVALWAIRNLRGRKQDGELTFKDAVVVGLAQALALIPGISRSGATIVAAMAMGMKQDTALRFSFFMYIPVSLGAMILEGGAIVSDPHWEKLFWPYIVAFVISLIASYYSLRWFMGIMARGNLKYFAYYCFVAGSFVLLFLSF